MDVNPFYDSDAAEEFESIDRPVRKTAKIIYTIPKFYSILTEDKEHFPKFKSKKIVLHYNTSRVDIKEAFFQITLEKKSEDDFHIVVALIDGAPLVISSMIDLKIYHGVHELKRIQRYLPMEGRVNDDCPNSGPVHAIEFDVSKYELRKFNEWDICRENLGGRLDLLEEEEEEESRSSSTENDLQGRNSEEDLRIECKFHCCVDFETTEPEPINVSTMSETSNY